MRNEKILKIFLEFANSKNKETLKQEFYDYLREIVIENVEKAIKLRRARLTSEKKIIVFLSRHLRTREDCIEDEIIASASR